jgi:meso-butanediol dehydrogenase/(S,S)-butanediol dehydrogenase/diacetyl reductase
MKTAFVTGAGSGIGRETALALHRRGCAAGVMDLADGAAERVATEIRELGGQAVGVMGDVSREAAVQAAIAATTEAFGPLDVAATCAGVEVYGSATDMDLSDWHKAIEVNLNGTMFVARHAIPSMLDSGGGSFVAVSSDAGMYGAAGMAPYCVSKHAVIGLVRCMALDFGPKGIRTSAVCPGFVDTPMLARIIDDDDEADRRTWEGMVPMGRFCRPDEVANVICHLASDEASYTNGMVYLLDGGLWAGFAG